MRGGQGGRAFAAKSAIAPVSILVAQSGQRLQEVLFLNDLEDYAVGSDLRR
jgi:hypothetical protein